MTNSDQAPWPKRMQTWARHSHRTRRRAMAYVLFEEVQRVVDAVVFSTTNLLKHRFSRKTKSGENHWDLIIVGGGTAGVMASIFAAERGARILIIEATSRLGGTLFLSGGQLSAAGSKLQESKGIADTPDEHFDDIMRISENTARPETVKLAVANAAETLDWLIDEGFTPQAGHPVKGRSHEPYRTARYCWANRNGYAILKILRRRIRADIRKGRVTVKYNTRATRLIQQSDGAVTGIEAATRRGKASVYRSGQIILSSGGYNSNPHFMQQYHRSPKYTHSSNPYALGDGLRMGLEAGAYLWGEEFFLPDFGRILADAQYPSPTIAWINTKPEGRTVWEVYVNEEGQRFVREDSSSIHTKERALLDQPQHRFWVILDEFGLSQSTSLVGNWSTQKLHKAFDHKAMFWKAHTLEELAQAAGISPAGLVETISKYNLGCQSGQDLFGRIQLPAPIAKPPFYAICCHGCSIVSCGGIAVNSNLEVLRKEGGIVPGLYAAGEILGKAAFSGQSRCGGMSLTPALTLGRLLGQKIIRIG